jgi:phosphatidylglycerol:prolipoprotein diacylglycerol transferase
MPMFTMPIDPILVSFGHVAVRWYSLIVMAAIFAGIWVVSREAERKGLARAAIYDLSLWLVFAGIAGARLFHVIDHWSHEYAANPVRALYVWEGGLAIWGGVVGGLIALSVFAWRKRWSLPQLLDTFAPGLVLGQAIGRAACLITGDAMGPATNGPLGIAYASPHAMVPELGVYYTPTPAYELVMNLAIFALLMRLRRRNLPDGALFLIYLVLYAVGRFVVTFWSTYQTVALGLNQAQIVSMAAFAVGLPMLLYLFHRQERQREAGRSLL